MANKMLIDAMHPEETRVVTVQGSKVEEFDFEAANRRQLRGNIYLAKVTRVEPSLQAAFVEYGGNRHGFLAFNEIHPDYYQIPLADRQALLEEEAREAEEFREREERRRRSPRRSRGRRAEARSRRDDTVSTEDSAGAGAAVEGEEILSAALPDTLADNAEAVREELATEGHAAEDGAFTPETAGEPVAASTELDSEVPAEARIALTEELTSAAEPEELSADAASDVAGQHETDEELDADEDDESEDDEDEDDGEEDEDEEDGDEEDEGEDDSDDPDAEPKIAQIGGNGDALAEIPERPRAPRRHYKIQEVIKRRQIILVQVVKEERGTKGAALTTYLSLAGRYSVLMPNTGRGGGISRKITSAADRKRLKDVVADLDVPGGMGVILRTAGASRSKPEIARDFEYLMRLWESVRELTLTSIAPSLVYEEGSLIKRAIRDLYNKELDEVLVAGEDAYREAKDFMRMLMPDQVKVVKPYRDTTPVFARFGVEAQLDAMFSTHVSLKSGGYLVINPTEALVSIDVNSGRATREHDIEDTALKTNLEAAEEVARQLRLRDLAGLIVIDFIDMEEKRNNRAVEKKLNDCLKSDRARIQVGRISPFGLMEMSRQRIRTGLLESSSIPCPHCGGSGFVRATSSVALHILRSIEEALLKSASHNLILRTRTEVALYILNQKRAHLHEIEMRFGVTVTIAADERLPATSAFQLDRGDPAQRAEGPVTGVRATAISPTTDFEDEAEDETEELEAVEAPEADTAAVETAGDETREDGEGKRRRRRRRRRGGRPEGSETREAGSDEGDEESEDETTEPTASEGEDEAGEAVEVAATEGEDGANGNGDKGRRRRRGRRGGRGRTERTGQREDEGQSDESSADETSADEASADEVMTVEATATEVPDHGETAVHFASEEPVSAETLEAVEAEPMLTRPVEPTAEQPVTAEEVAQAAEPAEPAPVERPAEPVAVVLTPPSDPSRPKRAGWWSRTKAALTGE
ncbi:ribonuclease E/G [Methylobacterium sp. J-076]|uniref:ribonuclease E/G n=1 Tax=Methylobacterium sp. J-076 TaxID=2836655 RepID=UPI001FBB5E10|nr:ribonuclease E/G [Methylobacterium sp. J-076]MCJ2014056.1 Rne/Rng family ribonuclease [Methylobacterium sp. J-076]